MVKVRADDLDDVADDADEPESAGPEVDQDRKKDLSKRAGVREQLTDLMDDIEDGFETQADRADLNMDYWDVFNCELTGKQFYNGNSQIFVPLVHDAVNARKTRFTNQIFPQTGRYVEVVSANGDIPNGHVALLEDYVRKAKLRTKVMPALVRNGDVEGQYTLFVSWQKTRRDVMWRDTKPPVDDDGTPNPVAEDVEDIEEKEVISQHPCVEVIADNDILILPQTADTLEEAVADGGSVTLIRRWGAGKIRQLIREGTIRKDAGQGLLARLNAASAGDKDKTVKTKLDAAGIQYRDDCGYFAQIYQTWSILKVAGKRMLCEIYYGGENQILGARRNPLWSDRVPILSVPVEKVAGVFKGTSKVKPVADIQYFANDAINEAADSAAYALMPIVMTDPQKNPRVGSMVLSLAAVWETSPQDTQFAQFNQLWEKGFEMVSAAKAQIAQTLGVSPAAITSGGGASKSKPSQAEVAQEQQVDILTTADAVTVLEEGILTPLLEMFIEMDHQYRDKEVTVRSYGGMGERVNMEPVEPIQFNTRYHYTWFGVEQARSAQQVQQQIAGMNVLRGIPPEQMNGYQINLVPVINQLVSNTFGPRLAPLIFVSPEDQMPVPPDRENALLSSGFQVPTHPMDDDQHHIETHAQLLQTPDGKKPPEAKKVQTHIWEHLQQISKKQQSQMAPSQGAPGVPGGAVGQQPQPGVAGTPRIGAQPSGNIGGGQNPPGSIHHDQLDDPSVMPR